MDEIAFLISVLAIVIAILALFAASAAQVALREVQRKLRDVSGHGREGAVLDVVGDMVDRRSRVENESDSESAPEPEPQREPEPDQEPEPPREPEPAPESAPHHRPERTDRHPAAPATVHTLEERLGASLPIWFGAVALALAGVFLVKHFVERGLLGPGPRVGIAVAFGCALLGVAFRVRAGRPAIAQGLAAAGVAVLSAAVYAATALYGFLSPVMGTVAQGAVTGLAVSASLRFGPFVALLGLVGGFAIPALVGPGEIGAVTMFGYLTLLQIALAVLGRRQGWWWVPVLGAVGAFVWALVWPGLRSDGVPVVSAFAFVSAGVAVHASRGVRTRPGEGLPEVSVLVPWLVTAAALAVVLQDLSRTVFAAEHWGWIGAISVGSLVLASRDRAVAALPWLAVVVVGVRLLLVANPALWSPDGAIVATHAWAIVGYGLVFGVGGHLAAGGRGTLWSVLAWLPPAGSTIALFAAQRVELAVVWPALGAAAVAGGLALWTRRQAAGDGRAERESALWTAALFAVGFAVYQGIAPDWRVVALATIPVGAAALRGALDLPRLALVSIGLSVGLGAILLGDHLQSFGEAQWLFWNPPSLGTLAVSASLLATSRILHRAAPGAIAAAAHQTAFVAAAAALLLIWDAQLFDDLDLARDGFFVVSALAVAWLALGQALFRTAPRWAVPTRQRPGSHLTAVGLVALVGLSGLLFNPLWMRHSVGSWPIVNGLLLAYGGGGLLAFSAARSWREVGALRRAKVAAAIVFVCGFALVSLEVRQAYVGDLLVGPFPSRAEWYTYSAAWLVYGAILLAVGVLRDLRSLRCASLLVVLAAVLKVFLLDTSHLDGLLRVLSFFGLGVALIALAWVYQRFVVTKP